MAKFSYSAYLEQQKAQQEKASSVRATSGDFQVKYLNSYLKNDEDFVIVRFPYSTTDDFDIETSHIVEFPNQKYPQKVECLRKSLDEPIENCPFCAKGEKLVKRFCVVAIAYLPNEQGGVDLVPVVWDRPFQYAVELANKINEYGDLKECLFKVKRHGIGTSTTYSTDIVLNKSIYPESVYVKDFSSLDNVIPAKLLIRSYEKYQDALEQKERVESLVNDDNKSTTNQANSKVEEPRQPKQRNYTFSE